MEELQLKLNTLNSLVPARMPFVLGQVNEAIKIAEKAPNFERNLDIAIEIAHQLAHFYKDDVMMYNYLKYYQIPVTIICTKVDKVSRNNHEKSINIITKTLNASREDLILFSSITKMGKQEVYNKMLEHLELKWRR